MTIEIRRADERDAPVVALLGRLTFRETFAAQFVQHEKELCEYLDHTFSATKIKKSIGKLENRYWIASISGLPVGYGKLKFPSKHEHLEARAPAQLQKIYVLTEFISRRVGSALMNEILVERVRVGSDAIWLNVLLSNERAIRFYERQRWISLGETTFNIGTQSFHFLTLHKP
jgi:diamine N-acetyltransferase